MAATTARRVRLAATATALLMGGTLLGASTAQASSSADAAAWPEKPYGIVTAKSGLNVRQYPSTDSSVKDFLPYHAKRGLDCKIRAQVIAGNPYWYKLRNSNWWISARYVHNVGHVKLCKDKYPSAMNDSSMARKAMG